MSRLSLLAITIGFVAIACGDDVEVGKEASGGGGGSAALGGSGGTLSDSGGAPMVRECQNKVYECGDSIDNDGDNLTDSNDPDCLGACDNTEGSLYGGIPGQAGPDCTLDCYFDQDSGAGNDRCYWNHECDPLAVAPSYPPEGFDKGAKPRCEYDAAANTAGTSESCASLQQGQLPACEAFCKPLVPNGCDCFGCCELPAGSGKTVWLGSEDEDGNGVCSIADVDDPTKCRPCTQVKSCLNPCDACEVCVGRPVLPPQCNPDSGSAQCPPGVQACGQPGQGDCPVGQYCITGCCYNIPR